MLLLDCHSQELNFTKGLERLDQAHKLADEEREKDEQADRELRATKRQEA